MYAEQDLQRVSRVKGLRSAGFCCQRGCVVGSPLPHGVRSGTKQMSTQLFPPGASSLQVASPGRVSSALFIRTPGHIAGKAQEQAESDN